MSLGIAHWITSLDYPVASMDDWLALLRVQLQTAAAAQADILLLPEYTSDGWAHFMPAGMTPAAEADWVAAQSAQLLPHLQDLSRETGVALAAGSFSCKQGAANRNRAWMFFPDRAPVFHDKLVMTPEENGVFATGNRITVFTWRGWRIALLVCLDVEMPQLSHLLSQQDIDLLLVPSQTQKLSGYHRVFSCARARAVEMMAAVAVVGNTGGAAGYHSGASVFVPSEEQFGHTGIFAAAPVRNRDQGAGEILVARDIPLAAIRALRRGQQKPEAWPGPWPADNIEIHDEQKDAA